MMCIDVDFLADEGVNEKMSHTLRRGVVQAASSQRGGGGVVHCEALHREMFQVIPCAKVRLCLPSTVCPQRFALNCLPSTNLYLAQSPSWLWSVQPRRSTRL